MTIVKLSKDYLIAALYNIESTTLPHVWWIDKGGFIDLLYSIAFQQQS